ncbi:flagellar assembly protein FliW [Candidatus Sumerlaeota bacterium]
MNIATTRFGDLTVDDKDLIQIIGGLLGFPDSESFVILEHDAEEQSPFKWLQSIDTPDLAFVVVDPRLLKAGYRVALGQENTELLKSPDPDDHIPMVIVKIPQDDPAKMTANLRGPIVVSEKTRKGCQIVLSTEDYAFDHLIFPTVPDEAAAAGPANAAAPAANEAPATES